MIKKADGTTLTPKDFIEIIINDPRNKLVLEFCMHFNLEELAKTLFNEHACVKSDSYLDDIFALLEAAANDLRTHIEKQNEWTIVTKSVVKQYLTGNGQLMAKIDIDATFTPASE
ncbi:MAG: hypothetical protein AAB784_01765 [Patescibacteria group bacterium]